MPPVAMLAGSVLAPVAGSLIGKAVSGGDQDSANAARQAALQQILGISVPSVEQQRIALGKEAVAGTLSPTMEGTVTQGSSAMGGISTDPRLAQAQMKALATMQGLGNTGLSAQDRVALMNIRNQGAGDAQAAQQAILQNLSARGMGGGGAELAARLAASQGAANRTSQEGMNVAAQAQNKALQALMDSGSLGGQIRSQQFGEQAAQANAADIIARFNAANRQQVMGTNVGAQNQAQAANLANAQSVANTNVGLGNQQEMYNKGLYQQQFENQKAKAALASGQQNTNADVYQKQANATQGMWGTIGQGVGQGLSGLAANAAKPKTPEALNEDLRNQNQALPSFVGPKI